jgi:hypothetical protein
MDIKKIDGNTKFNNEKDANEALIELSNKLSSKYCPLIQRPCKGNYCMSFFKGNIRCKDGYGYILINLPRCNNALVYGYIEHDGLC